MGLGQICSQSPDLFESQCLNHFEARLHGLTDPCCFVTSWIPFVGILPNDKLDVDQFVGTNMHDVKDVKVIESGFVASL